MKHTNILIKASGDVVENSEFHEMCHKVASETSGKVVIICGSGKQINTALQKSGYKIKYCDTWERIIWSQEEDVIVRDTLQKTASTLQEILWGSDNIHVKGAWEEIGGVFCHINADTLIMTYYLWFDEIIILTFPWNKSSKEQKYKWYSKVQIQEL